MSVIIPAVFRKIIRGGAKKFDFGRDLMYYYNIGGINKVYSAGFAGRNNDRKKD